MSPDLWPEVRRDWCWLRVSQLYGNRMDQSRRVLSPLAPLPQTRARRLSCSLSFPSSLATASFPQRNTVPSVLPCPAAAGISPVPPQGHCVAEEGREGCCVPLNSPARLLLAASFSILGGRRRPRKLGPRSGVQQHVLLGHGISVVHPGRFVASEAGVRREVCGYELHVHFCSILLRFSLAPCELL